MPSRAAGVGIKSKLVGGSAVHHKLFRPIFLPLELEAQFWKCARRIVTAACALHQSKNMIMYQKYFHLWYLYTSKPIFSLLTIPVTRASYYCCLLMSCCGVMWWIQYILSQVLPMPSKSIVPWNWRSPIFEENFFTFLQTLCFLWLTHKNAFEKKNIFPLPHKMGRNLRNFIFSLYKLILSAWQLKYIKGVPACLTSY